MPQIVIRNRRPASDQPAFTPIPDFLLPLADTTTGNVTLPASLGSTVLTPGQSVTKTYAFLPAADLESLLTLARAGQVNFPGSTTPNIPKGLRVKELTYCLQGEEPSSAVEGDQVFDLSTSQFRTYDGTQWVIDGFDAWRTYDMSPAPQARMSSNAVEMDNGEILIVGGTSGYANTYLTATIPAGKTNAGQLGALCQRFDPVSGILRDACPMPSDNVAVSLGGRGVAGLFALPNGKVLAGGGSNFDIGVGAFLTDPNVAFSDWWTYDPATDDWTAVASSPETMLGLRFMLQLKDGRIFFAGFTSPSSTTWPSGANATTLEKQRFPMSLHTYTYNYLTDAWTQHGDMNKRRIFTRFVELENGNVFACGGTGDFQEQGLTEETCEIWNATTGLWSLTAAMPAIAEEEQTTSNVFGPAALTSISKGASLFGAQSGNVMGVRVNSLVPTQYYVGGTITLAGTTSSLVGTGDSFAKSGSVITLTDAAAAFLTTVSAGMPITIAGATSGGNNGTFTVTAIISNTQLRYTNAAGVAEAYAGSYTVKRNDGTYRINMVLQDVDGGFSRIYYYNENGVAQAGAGGTYTITETVPGKRYQPIVRALPGGKVLIAGGNRPPALHESGVGAVSLSSGTFTDLVTNSESMRRSSLIYDPTMNTYARTGSLNIARNAGAQMTLDNGRIVVMGGVSFNIGMLASSEIYDVLRGVWEDGALLAPVVDGNGHFVLFQGFSGNPPTGTSPAPGFVTSNVVSGNHFDFTVISTRLGDVLAVMGPAPWISPSPNGTTNVIAMYRPGRPSGGHYLRHYP